MANKNRGNKNRQANRNRAGKQRSGRSQQRDIDQVSEADLGNTPMRGDQEQEGMRRGE